MIMVHLGPTSTTKTYRPRVGDIGLVRISGAGGRIIRGLQWADGCGFEDYEHALGVVENDPAGDTGPVIVEAEPGGAVKVPLHYTGVRWLVCPNEYRSEMVHFLNLCADQKIPYSWLDYAAIGARRFHVPGGFLQNYIRTSQHMMCSQLVDWCANKAGWHLFDDGRWEGYVPPCDLNKLWHKHYDLHNGTAFQGA